MRRGFVLALMVSALGGAGAGFAQQATQDAPLVQAVPQQDSTTVQRADRLSSQILTIDSERLILESACGQRVTNDIDAKLEDLNAENIRIQAELTAEEDELVALRATTSAEGFKALADSFDQKVETTKNDQLARNAVLNEELIQGRNACLAAAEPALIEIMRRAGAAVILERRSVFYSYSAIDITDRAIALMDETIGAGDTTE